MRSGPKPEFHELLEHESIRHTILVPANQLVEVTVLRLPRSWAGPSGRRTGAFHDRQNNAAPREPSARMASRSVPPRSLISTEMSEQRAVARDGDQAAASVIVV
jgi:hypothetical protein